MAAASTKLPPPPLLWAAATVAAAARTRSRPGPGRPGPPFVVAASAAAAPGAARAGPQPARWPPGLGPWGPRMRGGGMARGSRRSPVVAVRCPVLPPARTRQLFFHMKICDTMRERIESLSATGVRHTQPAYRDPLPFGLSVFGWAVPPDPRWAVRLAGRQG